MSSDATLETLRRLAAENHLALKETYVFDRQAYDLSFTSSRSTAAFELRLSLEYLSDLRATPGYEPRARVFIASLAKRLQDPVPFGFFCQSGAAVRLKSNGRVSDIQNRDGVYVRVEINNLQTPGHRTFADVFIDGMDARAFGGDELRRYGAVMNTLRRAIDGGEVPLSGKESVTLVDLTLEHPQPAAQQSVEEFISSKVYWLAFRQGSKQTRVWIADQWDADYLGVAVPSLKQAAEILEAREIVSLDDSREFASAGRHLLLNPPVESGAEAARQVNIVKRALEELSRVYPKMLHVHQLQSTLKDLCPLTREQLLRAVQSAYEQKLLTCEALPEANGWADAANIRITEAGRRSLRQSLEPSSVESAPSSILSNAGRRHLAVLFTDIEGSTHLNKQLGDAKWGALRADHFEITRDCIRQNGGEQVKDTGDGVLAVFDAASYAAKCAVDLQERTVEFASRLPGYSFRIRIGLHVAEMEVRDRDIRGTAVNLASRVMGEAAGEQVFCTKGVMEAVQDHSPDWSRKVSWRLQGTKTLKGFETTPMEVWQLVWSGKESAPSADASNSLETLPGVALELTTAPQYPKCVLRFRLVNNCAKNFEPVEVHVLVPSSILDRPYSPAIDRAILEVSEQDLEGVTYTRIVYRNNRKSMRPSRFPGPEPLVSLLAPGMDSMLQHVMPETRYPLSGKDLDRPIKYKVFAKGVPPTEGSISLEGKLS